MSLKTVRTQTSTAVCDRCGVESGLIETQWGPDVFPNGWIRVASRGLGEDSPDTTVRADLCPDCAKLVTDVLSNGKGWPYPEEESK